MEILASPRSLRPRGDLHDRRRLVRVVLLLVLVSIAGASLATAEDPQASEDQVKAAFLVNFPKYVDWPAGAFSRDDSPFVIAVLDDPAVADEIAKVITGRTVNGRRIVLTRVASGDDVGACHLLFISAEAQRHSPAFLGTVAPGILTVGESDDFLDGGGVINLALRDRQVALEVNLNAAANAGITISSKLLRVAFVVAGKAR
jgi:YfiR/HmsC-like